MGNNKNLEAQDDRVLQVQDVALGYGRRPFLEGINLELMTGDFMGLVGPNGAGKSTLLRAILGVLQPLSGRVRLRSDARIGYVPQRMQLDAIYPLTALEVVRAGTMGARDDKRRWAFLRQAPRREGRDALARVGLEELASSPLRDLSGGQQQRVLIARALVRNPNLLILDEPTAGMDIPSEHELLDFVGNLAQERGLSVILVAHQLSLVAGLANKVAIINRAQQLFAAGPAHEMINSERLGDLYGHPMEVVGVGRGQTVRSAHCSDCPGKAAP